MCDLIFIDQGTILDNMKVVAAIAAELGEAPGPFPLDYLQDLIRDKKRVDNLMVLSHQAINPSNGDSVLSFFFFVSYLQK